MWIPTPLTIFINFQNQPEGPVGYIIAVEMVRRIAHGHHTIGKMRKRSRTGIVFQESVLHTVRAGKRVFGAGGEETVAQPSSPFP